MSLHKLRNIPKNVISLTCESSAEYMELTSELGLTGAPLKRNDSSRCTEKFSYCLCITVRTRESSIVGDASGLDPTQSWDMHDTASTSKESFIFRKKSAEFLIHPIITVVPIFAYGAVSKDFPKDYGG